VLDGIDRLTDPPGFRVRSHDMYGALPDVLIPEQAGRLELQDAVATAGKLAAMARIRDEIYRWTNGCEFLPPTLGSDGPVVGVVVGGTSFLAEAENYLEAYHQLRPRILGKGPIHQSRELVQNGKITGL
jgi:hypothetical protein